jgi:membrane-associated phospholipid phosphatase
MRPGTLTSTDGPQWPGKLLVAAAYGVGFVLLWGGSHALSDLQTERMPLYFQWERDVPYVGWVLPLYFSLDVLVAIAPFFFRTWRQSVPLMRTLLLQLLIAAPFFVLVPIEPGFQNEMATGVWGTYLFEPLGLENGSQWNHTPSLHVAYACTFAFALTSVPRWLRWTWALGVCVSTVLVHEHHLVCIAGGLVLFAATAWLAKRPVG